MINKLMNLNYYIQKFYFVRVEINMGKARIKKSNCSNQYCIMQGWISKINHSVVCIPNLFKISIKSKMLSYDSTNY